MDGMNQYFEWKVKLAGGKTNRSASGPSYSNGSNAEFGGAADIDIGSMVPIQKVDS
jgi:hypothetical protein